MLLAWWICKATISKRCVFVFRVLRRQSRRHRQYSRYSAFWRCTGQADCCITGHRLCLILGRVPALSKVAWRCKHPRKPGYSCSFFCYRSTLRYPHLTGHGKRLDHRLLTICLPGGNCLIQHECIARFVEMANAEYPLQSSYNTRGFWV